MKTKLTRKQIKEGIIDILWIDFIEKINSIWKSTIFNILNSNESYISFWTDTTDWYNVWISINSYNLIQRDFYNLTYDEYEKLEKAIKFLTWNWSDNDWEIRPWFLKYSESWYTETFIFN